MAAAWYGDTVDEARRCLALEHAVHLAESGELDSEDTIVDAAKAFEDYLRDGSGVRPEGDA